MSDRVISNQEPNTITILDFLKSLPSVGGLPPEPSKKMKDRSNTIVSDCDCDCDCCDACDCDGS